MQIDGKVFLVSGGASGLGAASAQMLIDAGASVMLVDVNAEALAAQVARLGNKARASVSDITQESAVQAAVDAALSAFGQINGVINCAGIVGAEKILGKECPHGLYSFSRVINVNLIGSFNLLRLAAVAIAESTADADGERGVIINTASVAAYDGQIASGPPPPASGALVGRPRPAPRHARRAGCRAMPSPPGISDPPLRAAAPPRVRESGPAGGPSPPRLGKPEEYAALARHIIENSMLNGEVIRLDGALRMAAR